MQIKFKFLQKSVGTDRKLIQQALEIPLPGHWPKMKLFDSPAICLLPFTRTDFSSPKQFLTCFLLALEL